MDHVATRPMIETGYAGRMLAGNTESGDLHVVKPFPNGILISVIDGLGHGHEAAVAAKIAGATLERYADESLMFLVKQCHEQLLGTRGVVMSIALLNFSQRTVNWIGIGNVEGVLLRAERGLKRERVLSRPGVVGYQLPPLHVQEVELSEGDLLIFATDGIEEEFSEGIKPWEAPQSIAESIFDRHAKATDDALVVVTRYLGVRQ